MKIGVYGGSFNPPHNGHKKVLTILLNLGIVDKVYVVPTGRNYIKPGLERFEHRLNMLKLCFNGQDNIQIVDVEDKDTQVYTYMTLDYFKERNKSDDIYFIMGSDNLKTFSTWKNYEYMLNNYHFIVIMRNEDSVESLKSLFNTDRIIFVENLSQLSSSFIREELNNGKNIDKYLDKEVVNYIKQNGLYNG